MTTADRGDDGAYAPLPSAPTAAVPALLATDGAATATWVPNVFTWVLTWRVLVTLELLVARGAHLVTHRVDALIWAVCAWTIMSVLPARYPPTRARRRRVVLVIDLAACLLLIVLATTPVALSLVAAYACSTAVSWAANRPVDAFIAAGACASAFIGMVVAAPDGMRAPAAATGTLSTFLFFSLATCGFFTVAHRIGALEIAEGLARERGRYRRDLHDRLGQALSGMHFEVQAVQASGADPHAAQRFASLADGYRDAQRMLDDLFQGGDEPLVGTNVASVISQEARRLGQQSSTQVVVDTRGDASRVPPWMRPHIVAIAGECVNNAIKNGHANLVDVSLNVTDELLVLSITDDGVGFDNPPGTISEREGHYGLREMAERARLCAGEVVIASQVGFGTRVRLHVPIPQHATQNVLERDASRLRENVWTLLAALRVTLGIVALMELVVLQLHHPTWFGAVVGVLVAIDIAVVALASSAVRSLLERGSAAAVLYAGGCGLAYAAMLVANLPAIMLLYAPLAILATGVMNGRRGAARAAVALLGAVALTAAGAALFGVLSDSELMACFVHVTDIALVGMAAVQGAKLLDRLETLQIRVRYQALAQLRHGLSGRMRAQLTERLMKLERHARELAHDTPASAQFVDETAQLAQQSTELKRRLREIVHALADPTTSHTEGHQGHV